MIKLIATDMDGTLLDSNDQLPTEFFDILHQLKEKKIHFVIASGRSYHDLTSFFEPYCHEIEFICDDGAQIKSQYFKPVPNLIPPQQLHKLLKICHELPSCKIILSRPNGMYATACEKQFEQTLSQYFKHITIVPRLEDVRDPIFRICVCDLKNPVNHSFPILSKALTPGFKVTMTGEIWLNITNPDVNKGAALQQLQHQLKISKTETMAFGDFHNDIEMLGQAKYSYVMANAHPDIFQYGQFKAKSHTENGVLEAIKHHLFNEKGSSE